VKTLLNKQLTLLPHSFTGKGVNLPGIYKFYGSDTEELYKSNLQIQNSDWHYRTKDVEYDLNSAGYRCPEFNTIDWENAIVIHGCSQVFGVGLAEDETITGQLQQFTNRQVINLGKNGASMMFSLANNILLENNFPKPFAVINHWTSTWRDTIFGIDHPYHISGPNLVKKYYKTQLRMLETLGVSFDDVSEDFTFKAQMMSHLCKILWRNTNYIETTWMDTTAEDLNCYEQKFLDIARDTQKRKGKEQGIRVAPKSVIDLEDHGHSGVKTAKQLAEYYAELLK
jgi:hypothetical protein